MTDRIADPWGPRTPYPRDGEWPVRVDEHTDGPVEKWIQSACTLCSHGCALDLGVRDGRVVGVRGRSVDRVNHGRLGPKGLYGWQALNADDRLVRPLVRRGGELVEMSWDEAMELVVERSRELLATKGPGSLGFYTSGQLFLEDYYTLALVARGGIGTNHLDGNTRLCTATAGQSLKETFGCDGQPAGLHDIEACDTILHVGINTAETQTVLWMHELDRLRGPDPPRTIVIDPRRTESARAAEVHLAIAPGTNLAVLNGLAQQLLEHGWIDREFVDLHTIGVAALEQTVASYTPERVAEICRVAGGGRPPGGADPRRGGAPAHVRPPGRLPVAPGDRLRLRCEQPQPAARDDRQVRRRDPADERTADGAEHARDRLQRRSAGLPQLAERGARRRAGVALERRANPDPALGPADACAGDLPLRRAGLDRVPLGQRHEPGRLAARAAAGSARSLPASSSSSSSRTRT